MMGKIQLFVLDDDSVYVERLAAFIRNSEFAEKLHVKLFTKLEFVMELLDRPQCEGILLMSEAYFPQLMNRCTSLIKIILSETIASSSDAEAKVPFLYRYQSLHQLLSRLVAFYWEKQKTGTAHGSRSTQVLSIYSSAGNSGKSITAIHLAKQLSFRGERVFYLSLETVSSASLWLQGDLARFSHILYYLKSTPELLGPKLELLKSCDQRLRIDYMAPKDQIREMQEMTGDAVRLLIEALTALDQYDFIIVDLEASVHPRILKALELSDHILWLLLDDLSDMFKTQALYKQIGSLQQLHFVINRYTGKHLNDLSVLGNNIVKGHLPYIPEWKSLHTPEQVWQSALFSEQVYDMFHACISGPLTFDLNEKGAAAS
ncbi:hypothetical protein [Paenibacillus sedimenti]|uniref:CobQ/CobB/MinD/ParA nucleotide binding domain-containing protein n=1 Tax=Paenibacillus sedimenti TaxID=2770274 RepID=A0A926KNH7_9BACL|nr:hypothetical protein [Paenibacillus sedimenti]MBD0379379.1 hypothetical protein [Paenibacillus sedimenti]